jgi:hypothetical protein
MKYFFILSHDKARQLAIETVRTVADGHIVEIKPKHRSLEQNSMLHSILTKVAMRVEWAGKLRDVDTWKRLLTAAWLRARGESIELLPAIDGHGVDVVFRHTSKLTVSEMSEFLEYVQAWGVEQGIEV